MKLIISPAKSLNYTSKLPVENSTQPILINEIKTLVKTLQNLSRKDLSSLMKISDDLASLNHERNQSFTFPFTQDNARPAVYAFDGDVYKGLDAYSIDKDKIDVLQNKVRILSGLYGVLKPLDLIQPYRLEMGTKLKVEEATNLYAFWGSKITDLLNEEMTDDEIFINLASNEYFKAIKKKELKVPIITPVFKELKGDTYKVVAFYAKKARGLMARYIIDNNIGDLEGLKGFNLENYEYSENLSSKNELVFIR